ncbi:hypothetical protein ACRU43_26705 [Mycobacterium colombiense]
MAATVRMDDQDDALNPMLHSVHAKSDRHRRGIDRRIDMSETPKVTWLFADGANREVDQAGTE